MRRIVIWLASTITIVVLLFGYHTSTNKSTSAATVPSASAPTTTSSPQASSSGNSSNIKTYTGSVAQTRWGPVQVKITVQDGKLTKVTVLAATERQPTGPGDQRPGAANLDRRNRKRAKRQDRHGQRCHGDQRWAICNPCKQPSTRPAYEQHSGPPRH